LRTDSQPSLCLDWVVIPDQPLIVFQLPPG
jgi:hypothetical protein